uniref:TFIIS N-terminal domain-containing protein n=1 Tax=Parascaris univalens TaxID=6257 RepID=A0A915BSS0_PARUN
DRSMDDDGEVRAKVKKYMRMLGNEEKMRHALRRLDSINMTLDLLSETGIGKAVNQLRNHEQYGDEALRIVNKWKDIARSHGLKQRKSRSSLSSEEREESPPSEPKKEKRYREKTPEESSEKEKKSKTLKSKASMKVADTSASTVSFEEMLARGDIVKPSKPKKPKLDLGDWKSSQVDVNYRPSKRLNFEPTPIIKEHHAGVSEAASMDVSMFKPRKDMRKIYAGRPKGDIEVPTLSTLCIRVLCANIDAIEEVGDTPYYLLKPVLEKCSPEQLSFIERRNPHLMEDSDELWEKIVNRVFPKCVTDNDETWRDCYTRMHVETERKLKMLSSRITQHSRESVAPVRKALLADAKAPRDVRKKQMRYGTAHQNHALPDACQISQARRAIFDKGSKEALANLPQAVRNADSTLGSHPEKKKANKKGALMQR